MYYFKIRADICDACIFYLLSTKEFLTSCIWTLLPFNMDLQRVQNNGDDKCVYACFSPAVAVFNQNISNPDGKCYFIEVCVRSCDGCVRYFFHVLTMCPCWREITVFMQLSILGRGKSGRALNKFSAPAVRGNHEQGGEEEGWMDSWAGVGTELGSAARALCLYTSHWPSSSVRSGASALLRQVTDSWASQSHWDCVGYEGVRGCCKEEQQLTFTQHGWAGLEGKLAGAYLNGLLAGLSKCRVVVTSSFQTEDVSTAEKEFWGKAWKEPIYS